VWLAGSLAQTTGNVQLAWTIVFTVLAVLFLLLFVYHRFVLPRPTTDAPVLDASGQASFAGVGRQFGVTFSAFFRNPNIWLILVFLLTYRLGEAQALKLIAPFILDPVNKGGLGLDNKSLGLVYGTLGVAALTVGGLVGGYAISRKGLKFWLWPMMLCVHIPNFVFVYMAATQPTEIAIVAACIMIEQLGYGFGFAAYLMFMIMVADGGADGKFESLGSNPHKTAHYSICTGFMALGMMLPGMVSGHIQAAVGYTHFFVWVCICTVPSMLVAVFLKIDPRFGKKDAA
jgi:PAT family beta-lactamase induction signal transducer AmpG